MTNASDTTIDKVPAASDADARASSPDADPPAAGTNARRHRRPKALVIAGVLILSTLIGILVAARHEGGDGPVGTPPAAVARDYVASVNADDWPHVRTLLAPGFVFHNDDNGFVQGRSGFLVWSQVLRDSFPNRTIEIAEVRVSDDVATVELRVSGSGGDARRCEPGARPQDVVKLRVRGRLIVEMWSTYSEFGLGC